MLSEKLTLLLFHSCSILCFLLKSLICFLSSSFLAADFDSYLTVNCKILSFTHLQVSTLMYSDFLPVKNDPYVLLSEFNSSAYALEYILSQLLDDIIPVTIFYLFCIILSLSRNSLVSLIPHLPSPRDDHFPGFFHCGFIFTLGEVHVNRIIKYIFFYFQLLFLGMPVTLNRVVLCISSLLLFIAEWYCIIWLYHSQFVYPFFCWWSFGWFLDMGYAYFFPCFL